jgi:pyrroloquinoline quinone (PQQ) biosynthesis protein C
MVLTAKPRKMSREKAQQIVDVIWKEVLDFHVRKVWDHPFNKELAAGTLPIEMIKAYCIHQWHWALEINNAIPYGYNADRSIYRRLPDVEEFVFDKAADEFGTPGPGGHQRMVDKLIEACGYTREETARFKCLPEMRAFIDHWCMLLAQGRLGQTILVGETWIPEWRKVWVKSLTTHYGFRRDALIYFSSHIEADSEDHRGGDAIGRDVMSHSTGNKWVVVRALEEGLAPENYEVAWRERGNAQVYGYLMWFDALYDHYDPRIKR